jgi:hypothetical protein
MPWRSAGSKSAMRPSDFGGTGLARCSRHRSERSGLRICAASPGGWHLDEVFVKINGTLCYLWRAVDHEGEVFRDRGHGEADKVAALKFLKRIMKKYGQPKSVVTDGLCSYPAAIGNADRPEGWPSAQLPRGNSHQPFRRQNEPCGSFGTRRHYKSSVQFGLRSTTIQPGTSSRHPRNLQTKTLGCAGRMAHSHGLILTWNSCPAKRIPWCIGPDFV